MSGQIEPFYLDLNERSMESALALVHSRYSTNTLGAWDLAAGALIVEEAGGVVTRIDGEVDYLTPPYSVIAGNQKIHGLLLDYFQNN